MSYEKRKEPKGRGPVGKGAVAGVKDRTASKAITSFRHPGLKELYEEGKSRHVSPAHQEKLRHILATLDHSSRPGDMNLPGFHLHPLKGKLKGHHAVSVSGNWRVTFRFEDGRAVAVDYVDYH